MMEEQPGDGYDLRVPGIHYDHNVLSPYPLQSPESMREQLAVAKSTISFLALESHKAEANYNTLKNEYTTLESLLMESGHTLQRLQLMYREEKEANAALTLSIAQAKERIAFLESRGSGTIEIAPTSSSSSSSSSSKSISTDDANIIDNSIIDISDRNNQSALIPAGVERAKVYHISVRNSLRDMAERLCDELCRVDDHISLLEPLIQRQRDEEQAAQVAAGLLSSPRRSPSPERDAVDFLFGSPSARLSVRVSVQEEDEEDDDDDDDLDNVSP